jgi:hypothetical protein
MKRSLTGRIAGGLVLGGAAAIATYALTRRRLLNWGATRAEVEGGQPGDDRVANANYVSTRAVTIHARPSEIWPWLAQMGYRRGGLYSYDWLDRAFGYLDGPSADAVLPEYQSIKAGDVIPLGRGPSWPVAEVVTERSLVLEPIAGKVTWSFSLVPIDDEATRLVTRVRFHVEPRVADRLMMAAIDPAAFMMTRRMLVGIKRRAEALAAMRDERPRRAVARVAPNV